jgi:hypothetical protein
LSYHQSVDIPFTPAEYIRTADTGRHRGRHRKDGKREANGRLSARVELPFSGYLAAHRVRSVDPGLIPQQPVLLGSGTSETFELRTRGGRLIGYLTENRTTGVVEVKNAEGRLAGYLRPMNGAIATLPWLRAAR